MCRNLNFQKKQVRIKESENRDEAKRKARSHFNFYTNLLKRKEENLRQKGKTTKHECLGETIVEK